LLNPNGRITGTRMIASLRSEIWGERNEMERRVYANRDGRDEGWCVRA
jgi:hypothetical protein